MASENENKEAKFHEELAQMEWEPLLPIEKKLIGWSIGLGVALLFILYWISTYFPKTHG